MAKRRTYWLVLLIAIVVVGVAGGSSVWAARNGQYLGFDIVNVKVNGKPISAEVPAIVVDGRTMLPVRAISEALGMKVGWDQETQTATLDKPEGGKLGPSYLWVDASVGNWQEQALSVAGNPLYDGVVMANPQGVVVVSRQAVEQLVSGALTDEEFQKRTQRYSLQNSLPASQDPPQQTGACAATYNIMAIQSKRIQGQMTPGSTRLQNGLWGHLVQYWTPVLEQQGCAAPASLSALPTPVTPKDTALCAQTRARVEEQRRSDVSQVRARLAGNGTLGGSPEVDLLWEANLKWDNYLLDQGCSP